MTNTLEGLSESRRALLEKRLQKARNKQADIPVIGRRPPDAPALLSFAQQRLWFLQQWEPDSSTYNIPLALRLSGVLDIAALRAAFAEIIRRHEVLHTCYTVVDEQPVQIIHPELALIQEVALLTTELAEASAAEIRRWIQAEAQRPFDIEHEPPIRVTLLRLNATEHVLLVTLHHIAADGWSIGVLMRELTVLYRAFSIGQPSPLLEPPIQYADFAYWQRLQTAVHATHLAYWQQRLSGAPATLDLPTDRPRPKVRTSNGAIYLFHLSPALTQTIRHIAQQERVTSFMVFLAGLQALLYRYSGQNDIVIGTPVAGRNMSQLEQMIGCFVNTLALRAQISGSMTMRELLWRVRDSLLSASDHQDLPFEQLVEALRPERDLSYSPIFQVMLVVNNVPRSTLDLQGVTIEHQDVDTRTAKFDLSLALDDVGATITGSLTYNTDLFDPPTIFRIIDHFQVLLAGMSTNLEQSLAHLPLLTTAERHTLLVERNQTLTSYPEVQSVVSLFKAQVEHTPYAFAVTFEERSYTYRELDQRSSRLAHYLQSLGAGPDVRIGLLLERSLEIMVGLLGILKAGAAYVPIDPRYPRDRVHFMLNDAQAPMLVTQSNLADWRTDDNLRVICLDRDWEAIVRYPDTHTPAPISSANLMYVLYTSGSTGRPKGVAVEHRQYLNYLNNIVRRLDVPHGSSFAIVSTFAADLGTTMIFGSICTGGRLHIISYTRAADPAALADYFRRQPIDVLKLTPSHFDTLRMLANPADIIPHRCLIFAGEACSWDTISAVRRITPTLVIQNHYGPTETTVATLTYVAPPARPRDAAAALPLNRPLGNTQVYILDARMQPVPIGVPGEIYIGGAGITRGYLHRPDLTAERFVPNPFAQGLGIRGRGSDPEPRSLIPAPRLYRTGDLARYSSDAMIEFLGRIDHQVKVRGYRIEIGEIEAALQAHPAIHDTVVIVREDTPGDKRLVAYSVQRSGVRIQESEDSAAETLAPDARSLIPELRSFLKERLPDYMIPLAFVFLPALPVTPNGKLDRAALPVPDFAQPSAAVALAAPCNDLEARIAGIWSAVLRRSAIGIDDSFFDIGGESFSAVRVVRQIGSDVSVMDLFKYPTIRALAEHLSCAQPDPDSILHRLTSLSGAKAEYTLVCVPYGGGSAISYRDLANCMPANYALYAVEIPGHDYARQGETLRPLDEVARECTEIIKRDINGPIILYGHCLGAALAIAIAQLLERANVPLVGAFVGGAFPMPRLPGPYFDMLAKIVPTDRWTSDRAFQDSLRALGGLTEQGDPDELRFLVRNLRHDARQAEAFYTSAYAKPQEQKLRAPMLCVVGKQDRATEFYQEEYQEWQCFSDTLDLAVIDNAGHFFQKHQAPQLAQIITDQVARWQAQIERMPHGVNPGAQTIPDQTPAEQTTPTTTAHRQRHYDRAPRRAATPRLTSFFLVTLGQFISMIGTGLTTFALGIWAYQQTGSVTDFAAISLFSILPSVLVSPIAGALTDRRDRRTIMIASDMLALSASIALALLVATEQLQIWHLYVVAAVGALAGAFRQPAYAAAVTQLTPKRYLGHANGIVQLGSATGNVFALLLGGTLILLLKLPGVVLLDIVSFLCAIGTLLLVRFPNTLFKRQEEPFLREITNGWRYIIKRRGLIALTIFFAIANFMASVVIILVTPLVLAFASAATLGSVMACGGIGMVVGSLVMSIWGGTRRRAEGMIAFVALFGLSALIIGARPAPIYPTIGMFGIGLCSALINAHWLSLVQVKVGLELQGRVLSTSQMLARSMMPLGYLLVGPFADHIFEPLMTRHGLLADRIGRLIGFGPGRGMALMIILTGVAALAWVVAGYYYRPLRHVDDMLPDAIPDVTISEDKDLLQQQADMHLLRTS